MLQSSFIFSPDIRVVNYPVVNIISHAEFPKLLWILLNLPLERIIHTRNDLFKLIPVNYFCVLKFYLRPK